MRHWCEMCRYSHDRYNYGDGDGNSIRNGCHYGMGYVTGYSRILCPAMLVTGVKLEEVVLNALLV